MMILALLALYVIGQTVGGDVYEFSRHYCCPSSHCFPTQEDLSHLQNNLTGRVLLPFMEEYNNKSKMENIWTRKSPAVIVVVSSTDDVITSMQFARKFNLRVTIQSSGHDYIGRSTGEGSFMINLSELKGIVVDLNSARHTSGEMTVKAGNNWGEIYEEANRHDRLAAGGAIKTISISGYTLGGGHGPLARSLGLGVDNVLEMKVVLSDGRLARCTENRTFVSDPSGRDLMYDDGDLFWALRGGGNSAYGVVVSFTIKLHPAPSQLVNAIVTFPMRSDTFDINYGYKLLNKLNNFIETLPKEWGGYVTFGNTPLVLPAAFTGLPFAITNIGTFSLSLLKVGPWDSETETTLEAYLSINATERIYYSIQNKTNFMEYVDGLYTPHSNRVYTVGVFMNQSSFNENFTNFIMDELILNNPDKADINCYGVLIGGQVSEYNITSAAIHPSFRTAAVWLGCVVTIAQSSSDFWDSASNDRFWIDKANQFSQKLMNFGSGQYVNEQTRDNPNWILDLYERNYPRLMLTKYRYDRDSFLGCWHCVASNIERSVTVSKGSHMHLVSWICMFSLSLTMILK